MMIGMFNEPTTLASAARLIGETLRSDYHIDPQDIFARLGIDTDDFFRTGARVSFVTMARLWRHAIAASGDPMLGFKVGARVVPSDFYVLGHAWLASATMLDALRRMSRYSAVFSTAIARVEVRPSPGGYLLTQTYAKTDPEPAKAARDASYAAFFRMCGFVNKESLRPLRAALTIPGEHRSSAYDDLFRCPISYGHPVEKWRFAAQDLESPLSGSVPDLVDVTDRIAEEYIASFDQNTVATAVRQQIMQMLPSGLADQQTVAERLYCSTSTLQRQLGAEGATYRSILDATRQELAERYLKAGEYTLAQIAFLVGFADQSNFARAFKRWTGMTPGEFRKAA